VSTEALDENEILDDAELKMDAAVDHVRGEFGKIRTGRANPQLITDLKVDYYGAPTPLQQLAGVSVPEPRMLVVSPYDRSAMRDIERAISTSDLGLTPNNDGQVIRVVFPELTEERRKQFVRLARERAEEGRVAIRNVRRSARTAVGKLADSGDIPDDEAQRAEVRLQELTDRYVAQVDQVLANKERELLEV
jgi:ribosome recycling factor